MWFLGLLLFAGSLFFGYTVAIHVLRERHLLIVIPVSFGISILFYLLPLNLLTYVFQLPVSSYLAMGMLTIVGIVISSRRGTTVPLRRPRTWEWVGLVVVSIFIAAYTVLRFLSGPDYDLYTRVPSVGFLANGLFPPVHPFFPDSILPDHYGRDLVVAALVSMTHMDMLVAAYMLAALLQVASCLMAYAVGKKFFHQPGVGYGMIFFLFLCAGAGFLGNRPLSQAGMLEATTHYYPFANFGFLFSTYLCMLGFRGRSWALTFVSGSALGVYAIVFETNFVVLLTVLGGWMVLDIITGKARSKGVVVHRFAILSGAVLLACTQGGVLTDLASRTLVRFSGQAHLQSEAEMGIRHEPSVTFPKSPLLHITSHEGELLSLFSVRFWRIQGIPLLLLPIVLVVCTVLRHRIAILFASFAVLFILLPACLDFGRNNPESFRFLTSAATSAACAFAIVWHRLIEMARAWPPAHRWFGIAGLLLLGAWAGRVELVHAIEFIPHTLSRPQRLHANFEALIRIHYPFIRQVDIEASRMLRPQVYKDDRLLTHLSDSDVVGTLHQSILAGMIGRPFVGYGVALQAETRVMPRDEQSWWLRPNGYRKKAFWETLDLDVLEDLKVTLLYVDPDKLTGFQRAFLRQRMERLKLVAEFSSGNERRQVYRLVKTVRKDAGLESPAFTLVEFDFNDRFSTAEFRRVKAVVRANRACAGRVAWSYRLIREGDSHPINEYDPINTYITVDLQECQSMDAEWNFVAPLDPGTFKVIFGARDGSGKFVALEAHPPLTIRVKSGSDSR